jgi:phenylalanyl-tRNA synthetase beta subunit
MDRSLTDDEINELQDSVRKALTDDLKVELR